jgi:uncharacterized protein YcbX
METNITIDKLYTYPLKSGHELELESTNISLGGLINDRRFLILRKSDNYILIIKSHPSIYEIKTKFNQDTPNKVEFIIPGFDSQVVDLDNINSDEILNDLIVEGTETNVLIIPNEALNKALSEYFQEEVVLCVSNKKRPVKELADVYDFTNLSDNDYLLFAAIGPILVTSNDTLKHMNALLTERGDKPVDMIVFRPNIVLNTGEAFLEDNINKFKVGNVIFRRLLYCGRCKQTTYDLKEKKYYENHQPLKLLKEINLHKSGEVVFGQYFGVEINEGESVKINKNQKVEVLEINQNL